MKHSRLLSSSSTAFLQQKLQLRAPYVAPLNILQVCGALRCALLRRGLAAPAPPAHASSPLPPAWHQTLTAPATHYPPSIPPPQVSCLKTLRAIEGGKPVDELLPADYKPSEKALALMSRGEPKHPYVAGIEDTM